MYDYTSIYEIKRYSDKYYSWIISQSWLTNHLMTYPPDFEISLSPLKLLLSNNNNNKKKKRERNCFWEHPSAQSPSFLDLLPQRCWIQEGSDIAMKHEAN